MRLIWSCMKMRARPGLPGPYLQPDTCKTRGYRARRPVVSHPEGYVTVSHVMHACICTCSPSRPYSMLLVVYSVCGNVGWECRLPSSSPMASSAALCGASCRRLPRGRRETLSWRCCRRHTPGPGLGAPGWQAQRASLPCQQSSRSPAQQLHCVSEHFTSAMAVQDTLDFTCSRSMDTHPRHNKHIGSLCARTRAVFVTCRTWVASTEVA